MPQIPNSVIEFIDLVRDGKARTLQDIHGSELLEKINRHPDRNSIENIIDGAFLEMGNANDHHVADELTRRFTLFFPDREPSSLVAALEDIIKKRVAGWDEVVQEFLPRDMIERIKREYETVYPQLQQLAKLPKHEAKQERDKLWESFKGTFSSFVDEESMPTLFAKLNVDFYKGIQHLSIDRFERNESDLDKVAPAYREAYANLSGANKELLQAFKTKLSQLFPKRSQKQNKYRQETENLIWNLAVAALVRGDFTRFDPVIGDEACEARPPFIMDVWDLLMKKFRHELSDLQKLADGYVYRHQKSYAEHDLQPPKDDGESLWSMAFTERAAAFKVALASIYGDTGDESEVKKWTVDGVEYLVSCYKNTAASHLATDELGMASFDRERNPFRWKPNNIKTKRSALQAELSNQSVQCLRALAARLAEEDKSFVSVANVLNKVNVTRGDKPIACLPIYETMRTVLTHELVNRRPIILSLYQISCTPDEGKEVHRPARYSFKPHTLFYESDGKRYQLSKTPQSGSINYSRPCLAIQAYQMVVENSEMTCGDGLVAFGATNDAYLDMIQQCDLSLLILTYAALHPIFPRTAVDGDLNPIEKPLEFMAKIYQSLHLPDGESQLITRAWTRFNLTGEVMGLTHELTTFANLGMANDMAGKQYIKRLLGNEWSHLGKTICERSMGNCSFSVHHMNVNSWEKVLERDSLALGRTAIPRFHDFQTGQSFGALPEKQDLEDGEKK